MFFSELLSIEQYPDLESLYIKSGQIHPGHKEIGEAIYQELVEGVRVALKTKSVRDCVRHRKYDAYRNASSTKDYVRSLLKVNPELLVIRIDLGFEKSYQVKESLVHLQKQFRRFLNNRRSKKLFGDLKGYFWKLEYGYRRGFFYRCFFFFDPNGLETGAMESLFECIGQYWVRSLGEGVGMFSDSSIQGGALLSKGAGLIGNADTSKKEELMSVVEYLWDKEVLVCLNLPVSEVGRRSRKTVRILGKGAVRA